MKKYFYKVKSKIKLFAVHRNEMICTKHCEDDKLCYASEQDKNEGKSLEAKHKFRLDKSKIQLSNFEKEYDFTYNNNNGLLFLKGLLHGAFKKNILNPDNHTNSKEKELYEETLLDYLKDRLKLIWGQYYFIDPSNSENDDAKGYFLSNKIANTNLEPSFSFPFFSNIKNIRGNYEFHKIPNDWLHFYIGLNETVRSEINFKNDFIKYFEDPQFIKRRNKDFEQFNNLMYISSGEIDHSIIQWFIQTFDIKNTSLKFKISLAKLDDDKVKEYISNYFENHNNTSINIFEKDNDDLIITENNLTIIEWFKKFGLINYNGLPTERLITAIEFFYFHLTNKENIIKNSDGGDGSVKNKVSYQTNNYFFNNSDVENSVLESNQEDIKLQFYDIISEDIVFDNFKKSCDKILPTIHDYNKIFEEKSEPSKILTTKDEILVLISSYIDLLILYGPKKTDFKNYLRFNVVSHFFQRNIIGIYNPIFKEETCKGFIISPIFSNPRLKLLGSNSSNKHKFLGYFLCLIKDSDDKGRNFFNWRIDTHGHKSKTVKKFYTEYLTKLLDFGRNMGVYETQNFFYKGILEKHINELEEHATRGALSQSELRNVRHNLGSRLIYLLSNIDFYTSNENWKLENYISSNVSKLSEDSIIKTYLENKGKTINEFIKDVLSKTTLDIDETNILQKFKFEQIANFNGYLNNRLFFLDDLTFSTPVMTTIKNAYKDIFQYLDNVKLLWNNISGIQDFKFKIEFKNQNGEVLTNENDIPLAIPNDMLGIQGFVNILENVIRNTAKHNNTKNCGVDDLTFSIQFKEIEINESLDEEAKNILQEYQNQFYEVIIGDNCKIDDIKSLVKDQNKRIDQSIKKENTHRLRDSGLGLLEMEASAAYLRMTDVTNIESDDFLLYFNESDKKENKYLNSKNNLNFIKAINNDGCLAYRFFMLKPKDFLFVTNEIDEKEIDKFEKNGITVKKNEEFKKQLPTTIYNHNFLIIVESFDENLLKQYKTHLPLRIIKLKNEDDIINKEDVEKAIWERRFNDIKGNFKDVLLITGYDEKNESHKCENSYKMLYNDHLDDFVIKIGLIENKKIQFIDALPSNSIKTLPYSKLEGISDYVFNNKNCELLKQKLFESAVNRILVIEERIQVYSETEWSADKTKVKYKDIYETSGITIPDSDTLDLDAKVFETEFIKKLKKYIIDNVNFHEFTIIHFSILERLYTENEEKNEDEINNFLNQLSEKSHIVVTSGRGKPKNLPKSVYFVELSSLINVFIDNRSKHNISNLIYNIRNI